MAEAIMFRVLADGLVVLHLGFILFVIFGGLVVALWPKAIWAHIPCAVWGITIELSGFICPLTSMENYLRLQAGQSAYSGDFIIHYIEPVIYPEGLTRELQVIMALLAFAINAVVYLWLLLKKRTRA